MTVKNPNEASKLLSRTWYASTTSFSQLTTFRRAAELGLPLVSAHVAQQMKDFAAELFTNDEHKDLFSDREAALAEFGSTEAFAKPMAEQTLAGYQSSIDAASLVFAHSILDAVAFDYCRVVALASPEAWEDVVEKKTVSLSFLKNNNYASALQDKVDAYLVQLERESLLWKIDRLFAMTQPAAGFSPVQDYNFDRARIESLDRRRHQIIHKQLLAAPVTTTDDEIWYFVCTGNYLMSLVARHFNLKISAHDVLTRD